MEEFLKSLHGASEENTLAALSRARDEYNYARLHLQEGSEKMWTFMNENPNISSSRKEKLRLLSRVAKGQNCGPEQERQRAVDAETDSR